MKRFLCLVGSQGYRDIARKLVEESLVLAKKYICRQL